MKSIVLAIFCLLLVQTISIASDWDGGEARHPYSVVGAGNLDLAAPFYFEITECGDGCVEIPTKNAVYRVYASGKVEKRAETWEVLTPKNESGNYDIGPQFLVPDSFEREIPEYDFYPYYYYIPGVSFYDETEPIPKAGYEDRLLQRVPRSRSEPTR